MVKGFKVQNCLLSQVDYSMSNVTPALKVCIIIIYENLSKVTFVILNLIQNLPAIDSISR